MELGFGRSLLAFILAALPSIIKVPLYKLAGAKIGKGVSIGFGSFILASSFSDISIGNYSQIRPFTFIACSSVSIGSYTEIAMLAWIWGAGRLDVGNKCYIGPRCIINLRRNNFKMGEYAGLGPGSIVYTHGQWLPYTQGWPRTYGDVVLEDYAWVPAKVFLSPGVKVGAKSIVGSGAVVTRDIPPNSFAAGVPAKVIQPIDNVMDHVDQDELFKRVGEIAEDLPNFFGFSVLSKHLDKGLGTIQFERRRLFHKDTWYLAISKPENIRSLFEHGISPGRLILFSIEPVPKESQEHLFVWFDLKNLKCSDISDPFAFEVWNFLRRTWCVTCDVIDHS
jgi:acetyltransferase-like isoleucine patch superfamily enzyme